MSKPSFFDMLFHKNSNNKVVNSDNDNNNIVSENIISENIISDDDYQSEDEDNTHDYIEDTKDNYEKYRDIHKLRQFIKSIPLTRDDVPKLNKVIKIPGYRFRNYYNNKVILSKYYNHPYNTSSFIDNDACISNTDKDNNDLFSDMTQTMYNNKIEMLTNKINNIDKDMKELHLIIDEMKNQNEILKDTINKHNSILLSLCELYAKYDPDFSNELMKSTKDRLNNQL
jgi:hypothetical protein